MQWLKNKGRQKSWSQRLRFGSRDLTQGGIKKAGVEGTGIKCKVSQQRAPKEKREKGGTLFIEGHTKKVGE